MLFALIGTDATESLAKRTAARPAHLARLDSLAALGRLVLAGPFPRLDDDGRPASGFSGSLIVAEFDTLKDASVWMSEDPYVTAGVFATYEVRPFKRVLP